MALAPFSQAYAHTTSIGYESAGPGAVNFWYGTYHGSSFTEGSFSLVGQDVTYSATVPFSLITTVKPAGLIDGTTNFYSGFGDTTLVATTGGPAPSSWQGVSFTNLLPGAYTFTYIPIAMPTSDWAPINAAILSSSITLTAALLGSPNPTTIDTSKPEFTEADAAAAAASGLPITFNGGTLAPTTTLTFEQPVTLLPTGGTVNVNNGDLTFANTVSGGGALTKLGHGALILTGANSYTGGTNVLAGTLIGDSSSLQGGIVNNASLVFDQSQGGAFGGTISGTGSLTKTNEGQLSITGINTYSGPTTVLAGRLAVNGSIANSIATIGAGGEIGGNGIIGGLIVRTHATAAPGNSIGQLHVATWVIFEPGSFYAVEVDVAGASDKVAATETATLQGGTVQITAAPGDYQPVTRYQILTAAGGVSGQFAGATSNLAFLSPVLGYDANGVTLALVRNDLTFASSAVTPNQVRTAAASDTAFRFGSPVYAALVDSSAAQARGGFDRLSGEIHATAASTAAADGDLVRDALSARLAGAVVDHPIGWGQVLGSWGSTDSDGNAARSDRRTAGVLMGGQRPLGDKGAVGVALGYTQTDFDADARAASGEIRSLHAWVYASANVAKVRLRGGLGYSALDVETRRDAGFGDFSNRLNGNYDGSTLQAFGEIGYPTQVGDLTIEPFAALAAMSVRLNRAAESGGGAAVRIASHDQGLRTATLGVRAEARLGGAGSPMTAHGMMAWRGADGDLSPTIRNQFAAGPSFLVDGAAVESSSLLAEAGIDWKVNSVMTVRADYVGRLGDDSQDHAVRASLTYSF